MSPTRPIDDRGLGTCHVLFTISNGIGTGNKNGIGIGAREGYLSPGWCEAWRWGNERFRGLLLGQRLLPTKGGEFKLLKKTFSAAGLGLVWVWTTWFYRYAIILLLADIALTQLGSRSYKPDFRIPWSSHRFSCTGWVLISYSIQVIHLLHRPERALRTNRRPAGVETSA